VLAAHCHARGSVSILLGGTLEESVGPASVEGRAGHVVVKPPGLEHRNRFGPVGAALVAIAGAPASLFEPRDWRWFRGAGLIRLAATAAVALREGDPFGAAQEAAWELIAAASEKGPERTHPGTPAWLSRIRDAIAAADERPSVAALARKAGVHPVYLTRAFRKSYGCSISGFVRRRRAERAADLLARTDLKISEVAALLDFSDQSHLCRVFRSEIGIAPSLYRSLLQDARAVRSN
jgi:AraC family transcriptional regulator